MPHITLSFKFAREIPSQGYRHQMYELLCAHLCRRAQTSPAPIALKIYPEAQFITALPNMQTDLFHVLFPDFNHAQFHNHASQRHSSVHGLFVTYYKYYAEAGKHTFPMSCKFCKLCDRSKHDKLRQLGHLVVLLLRGNLNNNGPVKWRKGGAQQTAQPREPRCIVGSHNALQREI
jgi:hypothetical protein